MQVNSYIVARAGQAEAGRPRAWRISTPDAVFWLAQDGAQSRLVRLPLPSGDADEGTYFDDGTRTACEALALTAETETANRWVRLGPARQTPEVSEGHP